MVVMSVPSQLNKGQVSLKVISSWRHLELQIVLKFVNILWVISEIEQIKKMPLHTVKNSFHSTKSQEKVSGPCQNKQQQAKDTYLAISLLCMCWHM